MARAGDLPPSSDPLGRAITAFRARFGTPRWGAAAPGRVNLIGEHTDYNDGFVLPIAIDRRAVVVAGPAADPGRSRVHALDLGETAEVDLRGALAPDGLRRGSWVSYVAGVFAGFARAGAPSPNLDVVIASTVPIGSGLASSAALEVALATLLEQVTGRALAPVEKALLCQRAENEYAGVPCGIMDQFVSVMGRRDHALLIDCRARRATPVPMPGPERLVVVIIDTRVHHALASGEYAARREACASAAKALGAASLRDASPELVEQRRAGLSPEEYRCARHVTSENARTLAAAEALRAAGPRALGRLMAKSHACLRHDFRVSCAELDTVVDLATASPGVFGARMTGAGFGGCVVALCEPTAVESLTHAVAAGYRVAHGRECDVFTTCARDGAAAVAV